MSSLESLKSVRDRKELARLLGFTPSSLTSIIYIASPEVKYTTFDIPKKGGGFRTIKAPNPKLKKLQWKTAKLLYECLSEIQAARNGKPVSFGYRKGGKITEHARLHKCRRYVLNLDLEDFFPSFNFGRVRGFFLKDKNFNLPDEVATTLAQIACDGIALPQGSPCSPVISELIGQVLDVRLIRFAKKCGVRYSRYADDITFSSPKKNFPATIATQNNPGSSTWQLSASLIRQIERAGFRVNHAKTRMNCRASRQTVTGLVVNKKVNVRREYYANARAMCDSLFYTGGYHIGKSGSAEFSNNFSSLRPLEGILSHIYNVIQSEDRREAKAQRSKPTAIRRLYRRFLFYKNCLALDKPLIITEGKTDPIYLREAVRSRIVYHPTLGSPGIKAFEFAIRFFSYRGQTHKIMELGGGSSDLKSIVFDYRHNLERHNGRKPIRNTPMSHPVILLVDNDDGLKGVAGPIKDNFRISINAKNTDLFYHVTGNLYLVKTPEDKGDCIESLLPPQWLTVKLDGKTFSASSRFDSSKHYGKEYLVKHVIQPNAKRIDFSSFDPLLDRIVAVLDDYAWKKATQAVLQS